MKRLCYLFTGIMLYFCVHAVSIDIDNSLEVWQQSADSHSGEFVVIAVRLPGMINEDNIRDLQHLDKELREIKYVQSVLSVTQLYHQMFDYDEDGYGDDVEDLQDELQKPFYENLLRGKDNTYAMFVRFTSLDSDIHARKKITQAIHEKLQKYPQYTFYAAGSPILNAHLDWESRKSSQVLLPVTMTLFSVLLMLLLKSWWLTLCILLCNGFMIATTLGIMAFGGYSLNMLSITIPPLLLVLSGANSIHIVHRFADHSTPFAIKSVAKPCALALGTTAIGFLSFSFSSLAVIREFGIFMACGLILSIFTNLWLLPQMMNQAQAKVFYLSTRFCKRLLFSPRIVIAISILLTLSAVAVATKFTTEMNVLKFLPPEHKVSSDYVFISQNVTGLFSIELEVTTKNEREIPWQWIDRIGDDFAKNPHIAKVYGPTHLLRKMYSDAHGLESMTLLPENVNIDLMMISMEGLLKEEWQRMVKKNKVFVSLLVSSMEGKDAQQICQQIENINPPPELSVKAGGIIVAVNRAQHDLLRTQISSFFVAGIVISLLLFIVIPDKKLALIAIPVNVIPPIVTFATMVASGIAINPGTVLVASVAIGIALDDSLHFIYHFLQEERCVEKTLHKVGSAMCISSVSIVIGFAVLTMAPFTPLAYFGFFTCFSIVIALISDFVLLPALIRHFWRN